MGVKVFIGQTLPDCRSDNTFSHLVKLLTRISHSPVKTRVFSIQDVNEPGTHQRMAFIRANAPVLVLSDASGVCFSVTF